MAKIELAQLLKAGVHFGHRANRWNPKMFPYIYTERNGIHIIDLIQTAELLEKACSFLQSSAQEGKTVLFVGTKRQASSIIAREATRCSSYYVNHRWLGGMLTNWVTLEGRVKRLKILEEAEATGNLEKLPKKERSKAKKELEKLKRNFDGLKGLSSCPDIIVIVDQKRERTAVKEAIALGIPIISILDTNCDPEFATIPIPGNDDAIRSIKFILEKLADHVCIGKQNQNRQSD